MELTRIPLPNGKVTGGELQFGNSTVRLAEELPALGIVSPPIMVGIVLPGVGGAYSALFLETDDVDALWKRALAAGADAFHPVEEAFGGARYGQIIDPFGHRWGLVQHIRDVPPDELARAAARALRGSE